jgi:hypothetical protein
VDDIQEIKFVVGGKTYRERQLPPFRLEVRSKDERFKKFWINAKVFTREDVRFLERLPELSKAGCSDSIQDGA